MRLGVKHWATSVAIGVGILYPTFANAQTPEEFYAGKTVTLLIGSSAGSATDTAGRLFAEQFKKHFPGNPTIVVQNMAGAGGLVAASHLQLNAPADGTVIALLQRSNLYTPLVLSQEAQFDPREVEWIGAINGGEYPQTVIAFEHSPVQSADEMFTESMIIGATAFAHESRVIPEMMNKYLGTKFDIVPGYENRGAVFLAMERGEVDGWMQGFSILATPEGGGNYLEAGQVKPIVVVGFERNPDFPEVPSLDEYIKDDSQRAVAEFFLAPLKSGRPFAVPSGVPDDRLAALRQAFEDTLLDPEAAAQLENDLRSPAMLVTSDEVEGVVSSIYSVDDEILSGVRELMTE